MSDPIAELYGSGGGPRAPKFVFERVGVVVEGDVVGLASVQLPKYRGKPGELETWDDGGPRYTVIVTLDRGGGDMVAVFATRGVFTAFAAACHQVWPSPPTQDQIRGRRLRVERIADVPSEAGVPRHVYTATLGPAAAGPAAAAPASGVSREMRSNFHSVFGRRWAEIAAARGWGVTGEGEQARRSVLRAWYGVDTLDRVTDAGITGQRGLLRLEQAEIESLLAAVDRAVGGS